MVLFAVDKKWHKINYKKMTADYCGDGGIPGYIIGTIIPDEISKEMLPVALAHETNHNVRWQYMKWSNEISLADMIVSEGLAEYFAALMYGEDKVGMWVRNTSKETLETVIKPLIHKNLDEKDIMKEVEEFWNRKTGK